MMTKINTEVSLAELIDEHHQKYQDAPRPYLGGSVMGHHCERWLWLSFRWAVVEQFPGRVLRLFRRGHNEEATVVDDLKAIGCAMTNTGEKQATVKIGPHMSGHADGIITHGLPGAEKTPHLLEIKTHARKSFDDLEKNGVKQSKPQHWAQMQIYMHGLGLKRTLYYAVCKDDDRIHTERIEYDKGAAETLIERGEKIVSAERMPDPISTDPSWYQCCFCAAHEFCHKTKMTQEVNCRTCAHATPESDGTWSCARWETGNIPDDFQRTGCDSHVLHPDLVPWPMKPSNDPHEAVYEINGTDVRNGEGDAYTFSSKELIAGGEACANELVGKVKETFPDAKVTGKEDVPF